MLAESEAPDDFLIHMFSHIQVTTPPSNSQTACRQSEEMSRFVPKLESDSLFSLARLAAGNSKLTCQLARPFTLLDGLETGKGRKMFFF